MTIVAGLVSVMAPALAAGVSASADPTQDTLAPGILPEPDATATSVAPPVIDDDVIAPDETAPAQPESVPQTTVPLAEPYPGLTAIPSNVEPVGPAAAPIQAVGTKSGEATRALQERLNELGFWVDEPDGKYGTVTSQAVMAFQKYLGLKRTGSVDKTTADWLTIFPERAHGLSNTGTLVEIDKERQLLFLVIDGRTVWTFNTSTGSGKAYTARNHNDPTKIESGDAQTPNGLYRTTRQRSQGWWEGDLGKIYRPKYFVGGIAIHGMTSVPGYPASHGCVRVSVPAMDFLWDLEVIPVGTPVWVHS